MKKSNGKRIIVATALLAAALCAVPTLGRVSAEEYASEFTYNPAPAQSEEIKVWKGDDDGDTVFGKNQNASAEDEGWSGQH